MKKLLILAALALALFQPPCASADEIAEIGQEKLAELVRQNGDKVIMLNFFATWCPPCKVEMPELVKLRNRYPQDKLLIVGLSVDEEKGVLPDFLKDIGVNYPVYMAGKDVTGAYGIHSVPHNAFYAPGGKLVISEPGLADMNILTQIVSQLLQEDGAAGRP